MGMRLDTEQLEMLGDKLVKLESTGVEVTQFKLGEHTVWLNWTKEGSEMPKPVIVGISLDKNAPAQAGQLVHRGASPLSTARTVGGTRGY